LPQPVCFRGLRLQSVSLSRSSEAFPSGDYALLPGNYKPVVMATQGAPLNSTLTNLLRGMGSKSIGKSQKGPKWCRKSRGSLATCLTLGRATPKPGWHPHANARPTQKKRSCPASFQTLQSSAAIVGHTHTDQSDPHGGSSPLTSRHQPHATRSNSVCKRSGRSVRQWANQTAGTGAAGATTPRAKQMRNLFSGAHRYVKVSRSLNTRRRSEPEAMPRSDLGYQPPKNAGAGFGEPRTWTIWQAPALVGETPAAACCGECGCVPGRLPKPELNWSKN
jgi:hypothetical protein